MPEQTKPLTKSQIVTALASQTGIDKKDCAAVLDALGNVIDQQMRHGPGEFRFLNLIKIGVKDVPAREAKHGVPNPFKPGETMDVAAKPASRKVKVTPLKTLKEMV